MAAPVQAPMPAPVQATVAVATPQAVKTETAPESQLIKSVEHNKP